MHILLADTIEVCGRSHKFMKLMDQSSPFPNNLPEGLAVCFLKKAWSGTTLSAQD